MSPADPLLPGAGLPRPARLPAPHLQPDPDPPVLPPAAPLPITAGRPQLWEAAALRGAAAPSPARPTWLSAPLRSPQPGSSTESILPRRTASDTRFSFASPSPSSEYHILEPESCSRY